ncbi:MAG: helix-turn-helix transcriptional regulator [Clostridia bacterium]|nr:helix-turn-helix transcriptional regulator [Clostridia bacterium]
MDETNELMHIGQRIRAARQAKGMSQADLAYAAGIGLPHISDIELGKKQLSILTFAKIVEVLEVSADEILRANVPAVNQIYQNEFAQLLQDCSPVESESLLKIVKEIKTVLHSKNDID